jgi:hypothetical protein
LVLVVKIIFWGRSRGELIGSLLVWGIAGSGTLRCGAWVLPSIQSWDSHHSSITVPTMYAVQRILEDPQTEDYRPVRLHSTSVLVLWLSLWPQARCWYYNLQQCLVHKSIRFLADSPKNLLAASLFLHITMGLQRPMPRCLGCWHCTRRAIALPVWSSTYHVVTTCGFVVAIAIRPTQA